MGSGRSQRPDESAFLTRPLIQWFFLFRGTTDQHPFHFLTAVQAPFTRSGGFLFAVTANTPFRTEAAVSALWLLSAKSAANKTPCFPTGPIFDLYFLFHAKRTWPVEVRIIGAGTTI